MNAVGSDSVVRSARTVSEATSILSDDKNWKDFDSAVAAFCCNQSMQVCESNTLISTLVGEGELTVTTFLFRISSHLFYVSDLEWFGSHGLLFMVNKLIENEVEKRSLEVRFAAKDSSLEDEVGINRSLRSQLTRVQRAAQDMEWKLQEQLAQANTLLQTEKALNAELQSQIAQLNTQMEHISEIHSEANSHFGDNSAVTSPSTMTTPASTWRDSSRRSTGSSWGGPDGRLMRVAEKLNITPNQAILAEVDD